MAFDVQLNTPAVARKPGIERCYATHDECRHSHHHEDRTGLNCLAIVLTNQLHALLPGKHCRRLLLSRLIAGSGEHHPGLWDVHLGRSNGWSSP